MEDCEIGICEEEEETICPECGKLIILTWSGIRCPNCGYFDCY